ncbi:type II secretion system F family protein [Jonesia quinghaiensis]|uniref:type II secretion system F family protein n=1 Tax=Jonesia quinghaiensis TaxID=262806 RepID=UPI000429832D|nr:type II secretion system F family protein [Jonesia quinghaiensis]
MSLLARARSARIARTQSPESAPISETVVIDLLITLLTSGHSLPSALTCIGEELKGVEGVALSQVATALIQGASWDEAWVVAPPRFLFLRDALRHGWHQGASVTSSLAATREQILHQGKDQAQASAQALGVNIALPVGLCYLPAFVLVGVVPTLVSLGFANLLAPTP